MSAPNRKKVPPVVRLPPRSDLETVLAKGAQAAVIFLGVIALIFVLRTGSFLLMPITLAIIVGLMLGPIALQLEKSGLPPGLSAAASVLVFLLALGSMVTALSAPLATWAAQVPQIWNELQFQLSHLSAPLETIRSLREEIRTVTGEANLTVAVEEGSPVETVAVLAPALLAQVLIFFASLYFFLATRHQTRLAILKMCTGRRLRWRATHIFRDVEDLVSRYLLSITLINAGLGIAVGFALWLAGVPSPALWGALAGILNFIIYIGPAIMALILTGVGIATFDSLSTMLLPPLIYLTLNAIEAQFVTPTVIGRRMTLNPFIVFLAIAFWLWLWGPVGGFIAVPALLIIFAVARNIIPGFPWGLTEETRRRFSRLP